MKKMGLCSITFRDKTAEEIITLVSDNGLDCIEWGGDIHVPSGDISVATKIGVLTRKAGLNCSSYGSYFKIGVDEDFYAVSKTVNALGADVIRVWAGEKDAEEYSDSEYAHLVSETIRCAGIAKKAGQKIVFEYHYRTFCNSASAILKLIADANSENVLTYWQPAYWLENLTDKERIAYNVSEIKVLREKIVNFHVYAWRGQERYALIKDKNEWKKYIDLLPEGNGYIEFVKDGIVEQFVDDAKTALTLI